MYRAEMQYILHIYMACSTKATTKNKSEEPIDLNEWLEIAIQIECGI
jgi:hypothetical protein